MKKFSIALLMMLLCSLPAHARTLSLDEALEYAIERNEDIKVADYSVDKMEYLIKEVRSTLYPTISASGQYMLYHAKSAPYEDIFPNPTTAYDFIFNAMNNYSGHGFTGGVGIEARQLLFAFGMVNLAIETAELSKDLMGVQKEAAIMNLRYSIRNAYFATLVYEENYKIAQQSYNNALNTKRKLSSSASVRTSQSDLIKVDADIASRKPVVDNAKLLLAQGYRLLEILCVLDEPITSLSTTFNDLDKPQMELANILALIPDSPAMRSMKMAVELDYKTAEGKKKSNNPMVNLVGSYSASLASDGFNIFSESNYTGEGAVGVVVSVPLFDGGKAKNQSRQAELDARINLNKMEQTQRQLESAITNSYETYLSKIETLKADNTAIQLAERSYQMSLARFLNGQTSATELNTVEQGLTALKMGRMGTLNAIYASLAQIEQIIGEL